jgi:LPXTG-motif cell wall-anchored protein
MSVARRFAAAFAVVGLGVLAYAVPASATESGAATDTGAAALPCVDGTVLTNLEVVIAAGTKFDPTLGVAAVRGKGGAPICAGTDVRLNLSIYRAPDTWDGTFFPGGRKDPAGLAWPQTELANQTAILKGDKPVELTVPVPTCGNVQIDLYTGWEIKKIGSGGTPRSRLIASALWSVGGVNGHPVLCTTPPTTPPGTPSETPTTSPGTPSETPTTPPAPTESSTAPAPPTPTKSEIVVPPAITPVTPAPQPIVVVSPPTGTTPVLASTGSNATIPMIAIGAGLLVAGIGLSLLGRRRRTV